MGRFVPERKLSAIVCLLVVMCLGFTTLQPVQAATVTLTASASNRYPSANIDSDGDGAVNWVIEPNLWNVVGGTGTVTMTFTYTSSDPYDLVVTVNLANVVQESSSGWVNAYPEIEYGAKVFNTVGPATDGPVALPARLGAMNDFKTTVNYQLTRQDANLPFNFNLETWLTRDTSRGRNVASNEVELMVWMDYNILQGAGSQVSTLTTGGKTYNVWRSGSVGTGGWEYFAFLPTSPSDSQTITIDWAPFIQKARSLSDRSSWENLYFTGVECGAEFGSPSYLASNKITWHILDEYMTTTTTPMLGGTTTTTTTTTTTRTTTTRTTTTTTAPGGTVTYNGQAYSIINIPFVKDGAGNLYWATTTLGKYINSWNLQTLTINGVDYTNKWAAADQWPWGNTLPAKINGYYFIHYVGNYAWSHFEAKT